MLRRLSVGVTIENTSILAFLPDFEGRPAFSAPLRDAITYWRTRTGNSNLVRLLRDKHYARVGPAALSGLIVLFHAQDCVRGAASRAKRRLTFEVAFGAWREPNLFIRIIE
jgi:hypothetical protein